MKKLLNSPHTKGLLLFSLLLFSPLNYSQAFDKELIIATKIAEPFAMKDKNGKRYGISIE